MDTRGTIKLFDGVYVGDESSSRDEELILLNRVAVVVNFTALPNYYHHYGIHYVTVEWPCTNFSDILTLISETRQQGQSVLLHGEGDLDYPVAASTIYVMERFRWSLFKTLEFISSRINSLAFTSESFEMLKRYELTMLNQETRLSYNWEQRPNDTEELVLRNTYLNSSHKEKSFPSTPSKPKLKEKRRISWKIVPAEKENLVVSHSKSKPNSSNFRDQVLLSVRKILNQEENVDNRRLKQISQADDQQYPTLKKYKSTYTLASLPSYEKQKEIPVVCLQLTQTDDKNDKNVNSSKRAKTQQVEGFTITRNRIQIGSNQKQIDKKSLNRKIPSDSLKKLKARQELKQTTNRSVSKQFPQKLR